MRVDRAALAVIGITAAAAVLRFWHLGGQSYWFDEALTVEHVNSSFGAMVSTLLNHEGEPPLYFALVWCWAKVFGDGEAALRSLSAVLGVLTVPVMYSATRALANRRAAIAVAALVAASPALIWYSQEARAYPLLIFLSALSLMFFARSLERPVARNLAGWAIASALAIASHYYAIFLIAPEALWLLARSRDRRAAALAVGGLGLAGAALLPFVLYQRSHGGVGWITESDSLGGRVRTAARFFTTGLPIPSQHLATIVIIAWLAALALVLWSGDRRTRHGTLVALGLGCVAIAIPLLAALLGTDYVLDRNLLPAWLPLVVVLGAGIGSTRMRPLALILGLVVLAIFLRQDIKIATDENVQRDAWRDVARALGRSSRERVIVVSPFWQAHALGMYVPRMAVLTARRPVTEVDTITYNGALGWDDPLRPTRPPAPFRPVRRIHVQRMTIVTFRAPRPTRVAPSPLMTRGPNATLPFVQGN
jgi:uncharacterized membrane protein